MTREQKVKEHFDLGYTHAYFEKNEDGRSIYRYYVDGDWSENGFITGDNLRFRYVCWKSDNLINFMNIITSPTCKI